ncbi:hypothetical protein ACQCU1_16175 [Sutcliffiella horikoshii]|uniref:hypothetical protein n=1 Tax=Sutcliffiella horikoshii TaxID=79883 RepID=UPI003CE9D2DA
MKKGKLIVLTGATVVIFFVMLHSNPTTALRTKVFFMGYPKAAFTSEIVEYEYGNLHDKDSKGYVFTEPPIEKATQGYLDTYQVKKMGIFYFAEFIKDV